ncbi:MAG: alpha/beta hydrolase [Bacteroidota bacterium]
MESEGYDKLIEVNSITASYDDLGEGFSPIIFIHGFPFSKSMWQPQVDFLKKTHHVIAYDIRGFGRSTSEVIRTASMELYAEDLIALMDGLHIEKAIVCGFSMGGYILLNALHRFPERFSGVILADTQCIADSQEAKENRNKTIEDIQENGLKSFAEKFILKLFCEASLKHKKEIVKSIKNQILNTSQDSIIGGLKAMANRSDTSASLIEIDVPTLIICGKEDVLTPVEQSKFLEKNIEKSSLHILKKAGHLSNLEQPDHFNKIILDFIENLPHLSTIKLYGNENLEMIPALENSEIDS